MEITYTLTEEDLLTFQLFAASKNPLVKQQRSKNLLALIVFIIIISYVIYWFEKDLYASLITGTLLICLLPVYLRSFYKRHMRKYAEHAGKSIMGIPSQLSITNEQIFSSRGGSSMQLSLTEVKTVYEIGEYFIVYLKNEQGYIIPKIQLPEQAAFKEEMIQLASQAGVPFKEELDWKWK